MLKRCSATSFFSGRGHFAPTRLTPARRARCDTLFPEDPLHHGFRREDRFEYQHLDVFRAMYNF